MTEWPEVEIIAKDNAVQFRVKVQAGAGKTRMQGVWNKALKLKVAPRAEAGAANRACLEYLSRQLDVPRNALVIIQGEFSNHKTIQVRGLTPEACKQKLLDMV